jgi:hypothetical protein
MMARKAYTRKEFEVTTNGVSSGKACLSVGEERLEGPFCGALRRDSGCLMRFIMLMSQVQVPGYPEKGLAKANPFCFAHRNSQSDYGLGRSSPL